MEFQPLEKEVFILKSYALQSLETKISQGYLLGIALDLVTKSMKLNLGDRARLITEYQNQNVTYNWIK